MSRAAEPGGPEGLLLVDKPAGWTSHDVVARIRKLAGMRRVGHAGTLDPLATGLLIVGLGRGTRLLGHLSLQTKEYDTTVRLGEETSTDDREGEVLRRAGTGHLDDASVRAATARLTGALWQVPPRVSAIKVAGRRAYAMARAGEQVELAPRRVTVSEFAVRAVRRCADGGMEVDAHVACTSGTYIRSLARDLGALLDCAGHVQELRRTTLGPYDVRSARTVTELEGDLRPLTLAEAATSAFPSVVVDASVAARLTYGQPITDVALPVEQAPVALLSGDDGRLLALARTDGAGTRSVAVFASV